MRYIFIFSLFLCVLAAQASAAGKVFNKDYSGISKIQAIIETHEGTITVDLLFKNAPNTVANFIDLANKGFYNGLTFHRVIQRFVVQGGSSNGDGTGDLGYKIDDEANDLSHVAGAVSMANSGVNTGDSQFFIVQWEQPYLNGMHTIFGMVENGLDVVYRIEPYDPIISVQIVETK
jgi:peptidyl-prolyl cis-trans isomerase B (cyclophilin B)